MESSFSVMNVVVAAAALAAITYVIAAALSSFIPALGQIRRDVADGLGDVFRVNAGAAAHRRRQRQLREEIDAELGRGGRWHDPETDIIRAAQHTQTIAAVDHKLREGVRSCYNLHWNLAEALGPESMVPVATYPLVQSARLRIVDLTEVLVEEISQYPLLAKAPELVALGFGARRLAGCCMSCPYFHTTVVDAPRPCPSLAAVSAGERDRGIKDGEIVD